MENLKSKDPLHGITLQKIVEQLVAHYGFDTLGELIKVKCFTDNPSVKSSLIFLRKKSRNIPYYIGVLLLFFYFCPKIKWNT